jgi:muramoyltetrapeptide carboxypeptidase
VKRPRIVIPPPIRSGARIAVVAPGSRVPREALDAGLKRLRAWGLEPVEGRHARAGLGDLAGEDAARAEDLIWAMEQPGFDAVWAARGGWGTSRLLSRVDVAAWRRDPRWLIGFSDLSALQAALLDAGIASLHAPLVADLARAERFVESDLRRWIGGVPASLAFRPGRRRVLVPGRALGRLAGGCLSVLAALAGTAWQPDFAGAIVLLEEVGEAPYRVDRMLWQLRCSGALDGVAGLALGQFEGCRPAAGRPSRPLREILADHAAELGVPALAGIPAGHGRRARALPLGFDAELDAEDGVLRLAPPSGDVGG